LADPCRSRTRRHRERLAPLIQGNWPDRVRVRYSRDGDDLRYRNTQAPVPGREVVTSPPRVSSGAHVQQDRVGKRAKESAQPASTCRAGAGNTSTSRHRVRNGRSGIFQGSTCHCDARRLWTVWAVNARQIDSAVRSPRPMPLSCHRAGRRLTAGG